MSNRIFQQPPDDESPAERELREIIASVVDLIQTLIDNHARFAPASVAEGPCSIRIVKPKFPWQADSLNDRPQIFEFVRRFPKAGGYQRHFAETIAGTVNGLYIGDRSKPTLLWAFVDSTEPDEVRAHSVNPSTN